MRAALAFVTVIVCVSSLAVAVPASAAPMAEVAKPSPGVSATGVKPIKFRFKTPPDDAKKSYRPKAMLWPKAATVELNLVGSGGKRVAKARTNGVPVWAGSATGPSKVSVQVLGQDGSARAGIAGVLLKVASAKGAGRTRVGLDYSGFAQAYGGNFGSRLRLDQLPACALTTPSVAACQKRTPVPSTNDPAAQEVSAEVSLAPTATDSAVLLAASATIGGDGGGSGGTYAATDLKASASWSEGGNSGSFNYTYPVTVPPASGGLAPAVALAYDSGTVDGQTASTNAQSSWVGDGWATPQSYVEQSFASCADSPEGSASPKATGDLCYNGPTLTLSLNGTSSSLVYDKDKGVWKSESDHGEVVSRVTGSNNGSGTYATDYWTVTTRGGTVFQFGRNQLPGWSSGNATTNSVDTVPVYSAHSGDPCYNSAGFDQSVCTMARRWNLDYVTDAHGDAMSYYYKQDTNHYGRNKGATMVSYVRDSHLDHIDYGFRDGGAYGTAPEKVVFTTGDRCISGTCQPLNSSTKANWPDVPYDLVCASGATCTTYSPSFFSTVRLTSITTQQYATSAYASVDSYALTQTMPDPGDGTSATLWLTSITRTGSDTTAGGSSSITLPSVSFTGKMLPNRVAASDGMPVFNRFRLLTITTETGSVISAAYEVPAACGSTSSLDPASNTGSCYPIRWTPDGIGPFVDWFNKYAVTLVTVTDPTGGAPETVTAYAYLGGAAWHYDENETVKAKYRTYGEFRGYSRVQTFTGDGSPQNQRTKTETAYYRGMSKNNSSTVVNVTDSLGGVHEDLDQLAGSPLETTDYQGEGGPVDNSTITAFWVSAATATRARDGLDALTANWVAPALTVSRQRLTDSATAWRYQETDDSYDADVSSPTVGVLKTSYSHTVPADSAYDRCTTNTYAPTSSSSRLVGLVAQTETDSVACAGFAQNTPASVPTALNALTAPSSVSRPAQVVANARTFYDDTNWSTTFPQTKAPTAGNVTMVQAAVDYTGGAYTYQTTARSAYDSYGRVVSAYDGNNNLTATTYSVNAVGLTTGITITNSLSLSVSTTLSTPRGLTMTTSDINSVVTSQQYDALGRATGVWLNGRATTAAANYKFTYTVSKTGISAVTTDRANDFNGYLESITLYDAMLRPRQTQTVTPQSGRMITDTFYDSRGWVSQTNDGWWDSTTTPAIGAPVNATQKAPIQTFNTYDGLGRAVIVTQARYEAPVETTTTVYNGDRTTVIPPAGGTVTTTVTDPIGRTRSLLEYQIRPQLNIPSDTFTGTFTIDPPVSTDGTGGIITTTYGYDGHGNQNTVTDVKNNTWTSQYNLLSQVVGKTDPDAGASSMLYDGNGNLLQSTDARGKIVSTTYDALNRPTGTFAAATAGQASTNQLTKMVYDNSDNAIAGLAYPKGHLTTATSYSGGQAYKFQARGFSIFGTSIGETVTIPAAEGALAGDYTVGHQYSTNNGLPLKDVYPLQGGLPKETTGYAYDGNDEPVTFGGLTGYVQGVTYDEHGRPSYQTLGTSTNLANITNTYDDHTGRLVRQRLVRQATTPNNVDQEDYQYDLAGNLIRQTTTRLAANSIGETQCYAYDELRRLTDAWTATDSCATRPTTSNSSMVGNTIGSGSVYWTSWGFDTLGNRTSQVQHSLSSGTDTTTTYKYDENGTGQPHTLTSTNTTGGATGTTSYAYDSAGNTFTRNLGTGSQALTWNESEQLASVTTTSGTTSNIYGADGQLLLQKDPGSTTLYIGNQQFVLNTSTNTVTGTRYYALPGGGSVIRTGASSSYSFALADLQGTPTLYLDSTAQTPAWRQHTPYGDPRGATISIPDNRGFLNKTLDNITGLTHLDAREYDTTIGRFISVDPVQDLADPQQWNGYAYAGNNPVTSSDPSGLRAGCIQCRDGGGDPTNQGPNTSGDVISSDKKGGVTRNNVTYRKQTNGGGSTTQYVDGYQLPSGGPSAEWFAHKIDNLCTSDDERAQQCAVAFKNSITANMLANVVCTLNPNDCDATYGHTLGTEFTLSLYKRRPLTAAEKATLLPAAEALAGMAAQGATEAGNIRNLGNASSGSSCNSFAYDTPVLMADQTSKPIRDVHVGDDVLATDPTTKTTAAEKVTALHKNLDTDLLDVETSDKDAQPAIIHTAAHHPFWDKTRATWTEAENLAPGDRLTTTGSHSVTVQGIARVWGPAYMLNLTVAHLHTYYVLAGTTPVLVHNEGGGSGIIGVDDLTSDQLSNYNRYVKKLPAAAEDTVITRGANGAVQFETKVPGRVPGSYALYTKAVGADGATVGYNKTTIVPDGSVAHVKDKFNLPGETC